MSNILSKITHKLLTKIENGICLSVRGGVCGGGSNIFIEFLGVSSNSKTKIFQKNFQKNFNIEYLRKSSISGGPKIFLLWPKFVFHTKISFSDYTLGYPI